MANRARDFLVRFLGDEKDLIRASKNVQAEVKKTESTLDKAGNKAKEYAGKFKAAIGVAAAGAVGLMIKEASGLEESVNAVEVVFGQSSKTIKDWGEGAAESAGLAQREFNEAASVIGSALKNAGFDMGEVADKTIALTQRAADMASVFNTTVPDALGAIQAALRGESDPIERYGVALSAAKVEAKAAALGFKKVNGEFEVQAKAAARLELILEQTNQVAGDFANTSDGLANSMRISSARTKDLAADLGEELLPVIGQVLQVVSDTNDQFANDDGATRWWSTFLAGIPWVEDWAAAMDDAAAAARMQAGAHTENQTALELSRSTINQMLEPTATLGSTFETAAGQVRDFASAQKELLSPTFAALAAADRHKDAQDGLTEAEEALVEARRAHGRNSEEVVAAEEAIEEAQLNVATSYVDMQVAAETLGNTIDTTVVAALERTLIAAGLAEEAVRRLLGLTLATGGVPIVEIRDPNRANQGPAVDTQGEFIERTSTHVTNNHITVTVPPHMTPTQARQAGSEIALGIERFRRERSEDLR